MCESTNNSLFRLPRRVCCHCFPPNVKHTATSELNGTSLEICLFSASPDQPHSPISRFSRHRKIHPSKRAEHANHCRRTVKSIHSLHHPQRRICCKQEPVISFAVAGRKAFLRNCTDTRNARVCGSGAIKERLGFPLLPSLENFLTTHIVPLH